MQMNQVMPAVYMPSYVLCPNNFSCHMYSVERLINQIRHLTAVQNRFYQYVAYAKVVREALRGVILYIHVLSFKYRPFIIRRSEGM